MPAFIAAGAPIASPFSHNASPLSARSPRRRCLQPARPAARRSPTRRDAAAAARAALDPLVLSEDNVNLALEEVKEKLGSMFGNSADNVAVGITGDVELASTDGPIVVLRLSGRFWHKRADVLARVAAYLTERIPEICDVEVEDARQLEDSEEESARLL